MSVVVEGDKSFHLGGPAHLVEEGRELAWAETHIRKSPDLKWVLGNFIQTSTEEASRPNSNGHIFPFDNDMKNAIANLPHRPLNLLHQPGRRVGTIAAAEFVYPTGEGAAEEAAEPPIVEALGAVWAYYEPDLLAALEMAHKEGQLYFSMEAVPQEITCKGKGEYAGCGKKYLYDGRTSNTYCDHLNETQARKVLHKPLFTACALIIPPVRPGWKNANVKELSKLIESNLVEAELAYNQISADLPHLDPKSWENIMGWFLAATQEEK